VVHAKEGLKPFPFMDWGVNENAPIRMIRMVIPQCPVDGTPELKQRDGTYRPNPAYTGEPNCQQAYKINNFGKWNVKKCEELEHDPWHTTFRRPVSEEILDEQGYVVDIKTRWRVEKRLNVIAVSDNMRHSSGQEVALAVAKGCKYLEDFGYESPCEFRNCSNPQKVNTRFGKYCSERHARLVAADKKHKILAITSDPSDEATDAVEEHNENVLGAISLYG
jgi:hypothetical protein